MKVNLQDPNPAVSFDLPGGGMIKIRPLAEGPLREILKQVEKKRVEYKEDRLGNLQRIEYTERDEEKYSELLWDYCIVDWEGIEDVDGSPVPCTSENKQILMRQSPEFSAVVGRFIDQLNRDEANRLEDEIKN